MSNMPHCRFENTLNDLRDCYEALAYKEWDEISESEQKKAKSLILLCEKIAEEFKHLTEE